MDGRSGRGREGRGWATCAGSRAQPPGLGTEPFHAAQVGGVGGGRMGAAWRGVDEEDGRPALAPELSPPAWGLSPFTQHRWVV